MFYDYEPDFINDLGTKWWLDSLTTKYARDPNTNDVSLNLSVWVVEKPGESKQFVIVDDNANPREVIFSHTSLENIAAHIDILKCEEKFNREQKNKT